MARPTAKLIDQLRVCLPRWDRDLQQIEKLQLEHKHSMMQQQEFQTKAAEAVAGKILGDLVDILGLETTQKLAPVLFSPRQERKLDPNLCSNSVASSGSRQPVTALNVETSTSRRGNSRRLRQRVRPSASQPFTRENSSAKRKPDLDPDLDLDDERQTKVHRSAGIKAPPPKTAGSDSVSSLSLPSIKSSGSYQYSNSEKNATPAIPKQDMTLQCRNIALGGDKTARITLQRYPFQGVWICAVQFPSGQNTRKLNTLMGRSIIPGFVRLANRDFEQSASRLEPHQPTQHTLTEGESDSSDNEKPEQDVSSEKGI